MIGPDDSIAMNIDAADIELRKAFLEFGQRDVAQLKALHECLASDRDAYIDAFYAHLASFSELGAFLGDDATLKRLKLAQSAYFDQLTSGDYGDAYIQNRQGVGIAHQRAGLAPKWYISAYCKYLALVIPRITQAMQPDDTATTETLLSLLKIVFLDIGIAIDTYIDAQGRAIEQKASQLATLNQVAVTISSTLDWKKLLDTITSSSITLSGSKCVCLAFYEEETRCFGELHAQGLSDEFVANISFRPGRLAEQVLESGNCILSNDRPDSEYKLSKFMHEQGILCFLCLPLLSHGYPLGVLYLYRTDRDVFFPEEIDLLITFSHLAAGAIENARLQTHTLKLAATDALTGLMNRRALDERLNNEQQRAQRYNEAYALMLLDIDHFKKINDTHGHAAGDRVLRALADILARQIRDVDTVARYGGEEFVIVLTETEGEGAKIVAERIRKIVVGTPFQLPSGAEIDITISVGIACFPRCGETVENIMEHADQALYVAKRTGRNRVLLYNELLQAELEQNPDHVVHMLNSGNTRAAADIVNRNIPFRHDHVNTVIDTALALGKKLDLPAPDLLTLELAAVLHDIGYISIPESVLNKREPLTADETAMIRRHPLTSAALLEQVRALHDAVPVVRSHHEWYDGNGYPDQLQGEAIPYLARILSIADAYCAMLSDRPHRPAMTQAAAQATLLANASSQFDANIVGVFVEMLDENGDTA